MYKRSSVHTKTLFLFFLVLCFSANQSLFAQCGNYFKTNYRAVGKLRNANNLTFRLNDWTGDGKLDYWNFQLNSSTSTQNIIIYPSKTTGYWDWDNPIIYTTSIPSSISTNNTIIVDDFNSDGREDIHIATPSLYFIYLNNGNGTMTASPAISNPPNFLRSYGFYDINGDQYLDWVTLTNVPQVGSSIGYQPGNADGSFGTYVSLASGAVLNSAVISVGDFDGDGKNDIIYDYSNSSSDRAYVYMKNMSGGAFETKSPQVYGGYGPGDMTATADFNNDGKLDILRYYYGSPSGAQVRNLSILYGQSNSVFTYSPLNVYSPTTNVRRKILEVNGDTNPDIFEYGDGFYSIHTNNGNGTFTRNDYYSSLFNSQKNAPFPDLSGDNRADVIPGQALTNVFGERVALVRESVCQKFGETVTQDFDGDQTGDVITWQGSTGKWTSYNADWTRQFPTASTFYWGSASHGDIPAVGDFDGDGLTDYSVYRNSTGVWYIFLRANASWITFQFGLPGDIPVPGDYNGGGKTDFAVFRPDTGAWYIWYQETQQFYAVQFGLPGDKVVPADYDGDGKTDIAVWRPGTGAWYYLRSADNAFIGLQWGVSTDKPVPADYDGDGKADVTIYRNGVWYILRSNNNSFSALYWGTATDTPFPFYRTPDIAEFVVYRPSNRTLYNYSFQTSALGADTNQSILVATTLAKN